MIEDLLRLIGLSFVTPAETFTREFSEVGNRVEGLEQLAVTAVADWMGPADVTVVVEGGLRTSPIETLRFVVGVTASFEDS